MYTPLIQNTLVKQICDYNHTLNLHDLVSATALES